MKVLILHQHFKTPETGGAIRSYYLAKALADHGLNPVVITAHNESGYRKTYIDGIEVHYLPVPYDNKFGFGARSVAFLRFVWKSLQLTRTWTDVDICYAISVPLTVGLAARRLKTRQGIPFIFEVGDLWPDAPVQMGFVRNTLLARFLYGMEHRIYREADSIVALSTAIQSAVEKKSPGKAIHLIPNMADIDFFATAAKENGLIGKFNVHGKFVVSYTGSIGIANGLDYVIACAAISQRANLPIHFLVAGEGADLDRLRRAADDQKLRNITFFGLMNRDGVKEILNVSDAVLVSYRHVPILETGSPNKYFDGLAAGKLVIVNFGGWILGEIEAQACGIGVDPTNAEDFVTKIKPFLANTELLTRYQHSARQLAVRKYSRQTLSLQFAQLFSRLKTID